MKIGNDKRKVTVPYRLSFDIPMSISIEQGIADKFKMMVYNKNSDSSKELRNMSYDIVKVKDKRHIEDLSEKQINEIKTMLYSRAEVNKKHNFSEQVEKKVKERLA